MTYEFEIAIAEGPLELDLIFVVVDPIGVIVVLRGDPVKGPATDAGYLV